MNAWTPNPALYLSPEMVAELALGVDPPDEVAAKYGLSPQEFRQLQAQDWFGREVYRKREELHREGVTFVAQAGMMAREMWQDIYQKTKSQEVRIEHHILAAKELTEISGLKPKAAAAQSQGPTFQIVFNVPENAQGPSMAKIVAHGQEKPPPMIIELTAQDVTPQDTLPPLPAGMKIPDFKLTNDLAGAPCATSMSRP